MKVFFSRFLTGAACIVVVTMLAACGNTAKPMRVAIFYAGNYPKGTSEPNVFLVDEQRSGYHHITATPQAGGILPSPGPQLNIVEPFENNPDKEIAAIVRELVNDKDAESKGLAPVIALFGATSNEDSMRLASLSNAFKVPMIIPSSIGDNLLPPNNSWVFRLSAPGAEHAKYFFGEVLNHSVIDPLGVENENDRKTAESPTPTPTAKSSLSPSPTPSSSSLSSAAAKLVFKIAILYEEDTFGESAAVAAAKEAMKQGMVIGFYGKFNSSNPNYRDLKGQVDEIRTQGIRLVYLISSQPVVAQTVVQTIQAGIPAGQMPVLLGQSGAFSSIKFLHYPEAKGMYILRQKIVADCTVGSESLAKAQSSDAIALLRIAIENGRAAGKINDSQTPQQNRSAVLDEIKKISINLSCLGPVLFDETGQNKKLQFEILKITDAGPVVIEKNAFIKDVLTPTNSSDTSSPFDITP